MEIGLKLETDGCHGNQVTILAYTVYMYRYLCKFKAFILEQMRRLNRFMQQIAVIVVFIIVNKIGVN